MIVLRARILNVILNSNQVSSSLLAIINWYFTFKTLLISALVGVPLSHIRAFRPNHRSAIEKEREEGLNIRAFRSEQLRYPIFLSRIIVIAMGKGEKRRGVFYWTEFLGCLFRIVFAALAYDHDELDERRRVVPGGIRG